MNVSLWLRVTTLGEGDLTGEPELDLWYGDEELPGLLALTITPPPDLWLRARLKSGREMVWARAAWGLLSPDLCLTCRVSSIIF